MSDTLKSRWTVNLILLALVIGLGLVIRNEILSPRQPPTLASLDLSQLRLIEITRVGEPSIRIESEFTRGWVMREPLEVDCDPDKIERLLAILDSPVYRSMPESGAALDQLGLASPQVRLRLDNLKLAFGGLDPVHQYRYVAAEGIIHLIDDRFYHRLIAPAYSYVSLYVLPREFIPAFGTLSGVALSADTLKQLTGLRAERIDPIGPESDDIPVVLRSMSRQEAHFWVSPDHREWSRPELRLRYILTKTPALTEDPDAIDPTPARAVETDTRIPPGGWDWDVADPTLTPIDAGDLLSPTNALLPGDVPLGAPPEVRLGPETEQDQGGFGAEPYKEPPQGFGLDPFAPDQ